MAGSRQKERLRSDTRRAPLPAGKRILFTFATLLLPLLLLVLVELVLRASKYGPDLSLFVTEQIRGRTYHVMNPAVKGRYFARVQFTPSTSPDYFLMPKPAGTFRIFCLGGSTTVGYPYWYNGSFSSFLRDRLQATFPERQIDVINIGMTATNSFTTLDMARDVLAYEPDLLVVYDGHNEFYGALGAASHESFGTPRWLTDLSLRLLELRTFLLVRDAIAMILRIGGESERAQPLGTMMEKLARGQYIPFGGDTYATALDAFRSNLEDLRALGREHNVPVILGTQVSNLRDLPPFVSGEAPHLAPGERARLHEGINRGLAAFMNGATDSALHAFTGALAYDSLRAEIRYQIARCLDSLGNDGLARESYVRARDYDQLRFRTSTDFNRAIASMANGRSCIVVDMERAFMAHSPDSLIGSALMFEHLHPRSFGYFLMAGAYAKAMREAGILAPAEEWAARDTVSDRRLWESRPVTELDERTAQRRTAVLMSGWPFTDQFPTVDRVDDADTLGLIAEQLVRAQASWVKGHDMAADYYLRRGDLQRAAAEYRTIINQLPALDVVPYTKLARVLLDQEKPADVWDVLMRSLKVEPTILAYRALGDLALNARLGDTAAHYYEKTFTFAQSAAERVENGYLLALAYEMAGRPEKAEARIMTVLALQPDFGPGVQLLGRVRTKK